MSEDELTITTLSTNITTESTTVLPPYVCCAVTEGVWTWFGAILLIFVLCTIATLKYCKKRLAKPKFREKGHEVHLQCVLADDKGAMNLIRHHATSVSEFPTYYAKRRKHDTIDTLEFRKALESARKHPSAKNFGKKRTPYEYNRVVLKDSSESINASRMTNFRGEKVNQISYFILIA